MHPLRIAVITSYSHWGSFHPNDVWEPGPNKTAMVAGGETAMLWLARGLAEAGNEVTIFYDTPRSGTYHGVRFLPTTLKTMLLCTTDFDVLLSWEDIETMGTNHRALLSIYAVQCNTMQVGARDIAIDGYQMVSEWHVNQLYSTDPSVTASKFFIVPNGVDLERYKQGPVERQPHAIIHSSSPDRGLHHLLGMWPEIKKAVPDASLHLYYEMQRWFDLIAHLRTQGKATVTTDRAELIQRQLKELEGSDVFVHGPLSQWELAKHQMACDLMVYPCDPIAATEGFSISILEALAAGTPVITSPVDALQELWGECTVQLPVPPDYTQWVDAIQDVLIDRDRWQQLSDSGKETAQMYSWDIIGSEYAGLIWDKWYAKTLEPGLVAIPASEAFV